MARNVRFNFMLSDEEHEKLLAVAEWRGISAADVLRVAIRDRYEQATEKAPHNKVHRHAGKRAPK